MFPGLPPAYMILGWAYERAGLHADARKHYEISLEKEFSPAALASLGHLLGKTGDRAGALAMLEKLEAAHERHLISYVPGYARALVYAGLYETDKCLDALEVAYEQRCDWLIHLAVEKRWDQVRSHPRFTDLRARVGI